MLSFSDLRKLQLGGTYDAAAVAAAMLGGFMTHPLLLGLGTTGILSGAALSAVGGGWIGKRFADELRIDAFGSGSKMAINSSPVPRFDPQGVHLGFVSDSGDPLVVPMSSWMRHAMIVGQSGVGKTTLGLWIMLQQIQAGGGLMWIDGKLDFDNLLALWRMCAWCGREDDLLVLNPGDPGTSNSYNPLLDGDADEVAARCVGLIPTSESNAATDFYRQNATIAITTLVEAIQSLRKAYNFSDFRVLLTSDKGLNYLMNQCDPDSDAGRALNLFMDQFRTSGGKNGGQGGLSMDRMRTVFGGLGSRLAQFGQGKFGKVMNTYAPEINLFDCVTQNKILYVMLPTMGKSEAATALGKMVVSDFRSAIARVQALPEPQRPQRPFLGFYDEAGSYVTQAWSRMFEQCRSAHMVMCPAFQTKANLEVLGDELLAMTAGNTVTKVFFAPGEPDTSEWMADLIGKEEQAQYSISASSAESHKDTAVTERMAKGTVDSDTHNNNVGYSEARREDYKISSSRLSDLGAGECIVTLHGNQVYHVKVPRLTFSKEFEDEVGPFHVSHQRVRYTEGLNMVARMAQGSGDNDRSGGDEP